MTQSRSLTAPLCLLITIAAWLLAFVQGATTTELACAVVITALCAALALLACMAPKRPAQIPLTRKPQCETAEFRRRLFDLCAALKLGIGFCERHLDSEPELLIAHLEQLSEHIHTFVNESVCPVEFSAHTPSRAHGRLHWPWRRHPHAPPHREPTHLPGAQS